MQSNDVHDIDIVMPMNNLIKYSTDCSKTSIWQWQYYRDEPNATLPDSELFKSKVKWRKNP